MANNTEQAIARELQQLSLGDIMDPFYIQDRISRGVRDNSSYSGLSLDVEVTNDPTADEFWTPLRADELVGVVNVDQGAARKLNEVFIDAAAVAVAARLGELSTPTYVEVVACEQGTKVLRDIGFVTLEEWASGRTVGALGNGGQGRPLNIDPYDFDIKALLDDRKAYRNFLLRLRETALDRQTKDVAMVALSALFEKGEYLGTDERVYIGDFQLVSGSLGVALKNQRHESVRSDIQNFTNRWAVKHRNAKPRSSLLPNRKRRTSAANMIRRS